MALISCKSCGKPISSFAEKCPYCGFTQITSLPRYASTPYIGNYFLEFTFISAILGTVCFALSLYLTCANMTIDTFLILPYCILLSSFAVSISWAAAFTLQRSLLLVASIFYLASMFVMAFYALLFSILFLFPIGLSVLSYFSGRSRNYGDH